MPFWVDPSMPISRSTEIAWGQITGKPDWFENVSGGGLNGPPVKIDLNGGLVENVNADAAGNAPANTSNDKAAVGKIYIDEKLQGYPTSELVNSMNTTTLTSAKAYADEQLAGFKAVGNTWNNLNGKPTWTEHFTGDSARIFAKHTLDMSQNKIVNHLGPTSDTDVSNKKYVDDQKQDIQDTLDTAVANIRGDYIQYTKDYFTSNGQLLEWLKVSDENDRVEVYGNLDLKQTYTVTNLKYDAAPTSAVRNNEFNTHKTEFDALETSFTNFKASSEAATGTNSTDIAGLETRTGTLETTVAAGLNPSWSAVTDKPEFLGESPAFASYQARDANGNVIGGVDSTKLAVVRDLDCSGNTITNVGLPTGSDPTSVVTVGYLKTSNQHEELYREIENMVAADTRSMFVSGPKNDENGDPIATKMVVSVRSIPGTRIRARNDVYVKDAKAYVSATLALNDDLESLEMIGLAESDFTLIATPGTISGVTKNASFHLYSKPLEVTNIADTSDVHLHMYLTFTVYLTTDGSDVNIATPNYKEITVTTPPIKVDWAAPSIVTA